MIMLCFFIGLMLIAAILLLSAPFLKNHSYLGLLGTLSFLIIASIGLYSFFGSTKNTILWETQGKTHYQLLMQFNQLGGIDGIIDKIKNRLAQNPNDPEGWRILGKMYLFKKETQKANEAFKKADSLKK